MGAKAGYAHGARFLLVLMLSGGAVGSAYAATPGKYVAADRVRAAVDLLVAKVHRKTTETAAPLAATGPAAPGASVVPVAPSATVTPGAPVPPAGSLRTVVRVVDGDTVVLDGKEKVRLIGINTPETVDPRRPVQKYGKEASDRTKALLTGKSVRVEYDVERKDRYGRTLAYLFLEDGTFVNLSLVEDGFASAYRYPPNVKYADRFREAERSARTAGRGLWIATDDSSPKAPSKDGRRIKTGGGELKIPSAGPR